jgi:protein-tyrosine phosphatase
MDSANVRNTLRIIGDDAEGKIHKLLEFADSYEDVADPWYTGDFDRTYKDVLTGCKGLLRYIEKRQNK